MVESPWCIIVNSNTCKKEWNKWEKIIVKSKVHCTVYYTYSLEELEHQIKSTLDQGYRHYLFAGGDGTLHHGGNLLLKHGDQLHELIFSVLSCGTGNDWKRTFGIHKNHFIEILRKRNSRPFKLLKLEWPDKRESYAFNMIGAALDAAVVKSINDQPLMNQGGFLKYPLALLRTLLNKNTWKATLNVDDKIYTGDWLTIEAGFGKYCGGGMFVLPHATNDSPGLLLVRPKSLLRILTSIHKLYNGNIADQPEANAINFSRIEIVEGDQPVPLEADGEWLGYAPVIITSVKSNLRVLTAD
jgi:diacylglycerol kinase family enzyme